MPVLAGRRRFVLLLLFALAFVYPTATYWYDIQSTLTSASRPLWGTPPDGPRQIIPHYHAQGLWTTPEVCQLHGWIPRPVIESVERNMWDAIILDGPTEADLDLLEIRMHELYEVVDKVFIVESNRTINGTPKGYFFGDNRYDSRFSLFQYKIVYKAVPSPPPYSLRYSSPEAWSERLRGEMTDLLRTRSSNTLRTPLVLFAEIDEIPSAHTIRLLRDCVFPSPLHLQLRRFMYSFAWPIGWDSARAQVHVWDENSLPDAGPGVIDRVYTQYSHELASDFALADAGWQCIHCDKKLDDILERMRDKYGDATATLTPEVLQKAICEGKDLFNAVPEAYSYKDMLQLWNPEPSKSAVGIPKWIIVEASRYRHLLPGGCKRSMVENKKLEDS